MARRPKRSLVEELAQHAAIAAAINHLVLTLAALQPGIPEFVFAHRMLQDGHAQLRERLREADAQSPFNASDDDKAQTS